jgi:hypothetical protein
MANFLRRAPNAAMTLPDKGARSVNPSLGQSAEKNIDSDYNIISN